MREVTYRFNEEILPLNPAATVNKARNHGFSRLNYCKRCRNTKTSTPIDRFVASSLIARYCRLGDMTFPRREDFGRKYLGFLPLDQLVVV